ncbi:unnamed protein product [Tilletia controversa]|nr:unnamed protein product [Tilletia controversa]CAD6921118.1 unnamed protein product [Tilletia controversa]CAD6941204.1 unnamed protein product [Tilletia controversa]CAD6977487.1 unnamed protein product [Tilletia controversa]
MAGEGDARPSPPRRRSRWDHDDGDAGPVRERDYERKPSAGGSRHAHEPASTSRRGGGDYREDSRASDSWRHQDQGGSSSNSGRRRRDDYNEDDRHTSSSRARPPRPRSRSRSRSPPSSSSKKDIVPRSYRSDRALPPPPDFERDRRRERAAYGSATGGGNDGAGASKALSGPPPDGADPAVPEANFAPDFGTSGLLAAASNNVDGVALKYHEPPEARKPKSGKGWRLYVFKDGKDVDLIHLTRQSCYLFGREQRVVDIPLEHPSASKQHAVIQFRQITTRSEFGDQSSSIRPFFIDLESANGSYLNGNEVPTSRYVELKSGDTLKFGASSREWVLLPEDAA